MHHIRAASKRLETSAFPGLTPRLEANTDHGRAPITFGWLAYTGTGRTSRYYHLETLYRLDRVAAQTDQLVPSQYYGMAQEQLRELLRARQAARLPKLPCGYQWVGPELIENIEAGTPEQMDHAAPPRRSPQLEARLCIARRIASGVLRERELA